MCIGLAVYSDVIIYTYIIVHVYMYTTCTCMYILYVCTCMYVHCVSSHVLGEESSRKGKTHPPASGKLPVEGEDVKKIKYSAELISSGSYSLC